MADQALQARVENERSGMNERAFVPWLPWQHFHSTLDACVLGAIDIRPTQWIREFRFSRGPFGMEKPE